MKTVSMLEFRRQALDVVRSVQRGQRMILTYRGKPMARLEPLASPATGKDPFYALAGLADEAGKSMTNREMDEAIYGA